MSLESRIRKQVEFYFSDGNLRRDTFLNRQIAGDREGCTCGIRNRAR